MRRNWFIAAVVIGVLAIVVAAVAMRLSDDGSDGPEATTAWADSVCSSLSDWRTSIESIADVDSGGLTPDLLREKLEEAETATRDLVSELQDLGAPDLEAGDEFEQELDASVATLESSFDDLRDAASEASEAGAGDFLQALAGLATQFGEFVTAVRSTLDTLLDADVAEESRAELEQAFDDSASCQSLRGDG